MTDEWNPEPDELMNEVMGRMFEKLTQGDGQFLEDRRGFFSWATPGLPLNEDQFDFMTGFTGADEAERNKRFNYALDFATICDFVPRTDGLFDEDHQVSVFDNGVQKLSDEYQRVLRMSQVVDAEITEEQEAKLEKFRGLLRTTRVEKDIITDEEVTVVEDSPLVRQYNEKMAAYTAAALEYNSLRIDAMSGLVDGASAKFAVNGELLGRKVRAALDAWESVGRRSDVDRINAYIAQVTGRSMVLHKRNLEETFNAAKLTAPVSNQVFLYTALAPSNVLRSDGWTEFGFTSDSRSTSSVSKSSSFSAGGSGSFGFGLKLGGEASRESSSTKKKLNTKNFSFKFEMTEAPIARGWFDTAFLASRGWRFSEGGELLTDGKVPPEAGTLPAFPATMILVRNLELTMAELDDESSEITKAFNAKGKVGWGPFALKGEYKRGSSTVTSEMSKDGQTIKVPGCQIIGFRCNLTATDEGVPIPNPDPEVEEARWV